MPRDNMSKVRAPFRDGVVVSIANPSHKLFWLMLDRERIDESRDD
jgi:hypothetical protein